MKRETQEIRIDIEERSRLERELERVSDDGQIEFGTLKTRAEMQKVKNKELEY